MGANWSAIFALPQIAPREATHPGDQLATWAARIDYDAKDWHPFNADKLVVHWGGGAVSAAAALGVASAEEATLRGWESFHLSKGWLGLAYNFGIGNSGRLYRIRGDNRSGATSGDADKDGIPENHEAIAVVFLVGSGQTASNAALATFRRLYAVAGLETVIRHKDSTATSCPGPQLSAWVAGGGYTGAPPTTPTEDIVQELPTIGRYDGWNKAPDGTSTPELRPYVRNAQAMLANHGFIASATFDADHRPDGRFGNGTHKATEDFQAAKGLAVDGLIGNKTWAALLNV